MICVQSLEHYTDVHCTNLCKETRYNVQTFKGQQQYNGTAIPKEWTHHKDILLTIQCHCSEKSNTGTLSQYIVLYSCYIIIAHKYSEHMIHTVLLLISDTRGEQRSVKTHLSQGV